MNIARKLPSGKQAAVDVQNSAVKETAGVIMSPAFDLNRTNTVDSIRKADNKHNDIGVFTRKTEKQAEKKQIVGCAKVCESSLSVPDSHTNAK